MKVFAFALLLFLLLVGFIFFNYIYVNRTVDRLCLLTRQLSDVSSPILESRIEELCSLWESSRTLFELSSNDRDIESIDDLISSLLVYSRSRDSAEFENIRFQLINHFQSLAEFESLSLGDIL